MYGTIENWRRYATARGDTAPATADNAIATAALVRASDYIEIKYVNNFATSFATLPEYVKRATYIAASLELAKVGFFTKTFTPAEQKVLTQVGTIKWTPVGDASGLDAAVPVSTSIEMLLSPYLKSASAYAGGFAV